MIDGPQRVQSTNQKVSFCLAGAFKTLDKDNSGNIELDIKEVKRHIK